MILAWLALLAVEPPASPAVAAAPDLAPPVTVTDPLHDVVTQAIRNCPQSKGDEIAVCSRDRGFAERYRLQRLNRPTVDPGDPKIKLSGVGSTIPGECSDIGQAGAIGCSKRDYDAWAAWKRQQQAEKRAVP